MKHYRWRLAVLTTTLALFGCSGAGPPPIEVGHVSDRTGDRFAADSAEMGLTLALNELSKDETLLKELGGRKIQIRHTDTQGKIDAFESQAVRLESVNRCIALFGGRSQAATVALSNAKTPILTFHGQPTPGAGNHVFYLGMSPVRQGSALAQVVALEARTPLRVLILIDERRVESASVAESFQKTLDESRKKAGLEPAALLTLRFGKDARWKEITEREDVQKSGVVLFAGSAPDFNTWHKAHRAIRQKVMTYDPFLVFAGSDGEQRLFDLEGDTHASILLATAYDADSSSERIKTFTKSFRDAFQVEPDVHAALAHDGLRILVEAMKATHTQLTPEKLREELLKISKFDGLTGPLTINAARQVDRPLHVLRWRAGVNSHIKTLP